MTIFILLAYSLFYFNKFLKQIFNLILIFNFKIKLGGLGIFFIKINNVQNNNFTRKI